jgi:serralysin
MLITGTTGSDTIDGSADPDEIYGLEGDDHLYGHGGNDTLYGDDGDDMLAGGAGDDVLDGGAGNDTLWGASGADVIVFRDGYGHDVIMDFDVAEDVVNLASSGVETWADVQDRLGADTDGTALLTLDDGSTLRFEGLFPDDLTEDNFILPSPPVCFAAGTLIATPAGEVPVELLRPGNLILTLDHGPQPLLWLGMRQTVFGHGNHRHQPVRITAGSMGQGLPRRDLRVSPQHRLLVTGPDAKRFSRGALAKAKGLCGRTGIAQETDCTSVRYFQLLLPRHGIALAEGLPAETFLPRGFALATLPEADRATICAMIPALAEDPAAYGPPARPLLSMQQLAGLPDAALSTPATDRPAFAA